MTIRVDKVKALSVIFDTFSKNWVSNFKGFKFF